MENKKMAFYIGVPVVVVILAAAVSAWAFGPGSSSFGCRSGFKAGFMTHLDEKVQELNLNEEQEAVYQRLRDKLAANMQASRARHQALLNQIMSEMETETPDVEAIVGIVKTGLDEIPAKVGANLDLFVEFYNCLDADQKAQLTDKARRKLQLLHELHEM